MDSDFSGDEKPDDKQNPNEPNQVPGDQDIFDGLPIDGIQTMPDGVVVATVEQQSPDYLREASSILVSDLVPKQQKSVEPKSDKPLPKEPLPKEPLPKKKKDRNKKKK